MDSVSVDFEINGIRVKNSDDSFEIPLQAITGVLSTTVQSLPQQQTIFFRFHDDDYVSVAWEKEVRWVLPNFVLDGDPHSIQFFVLFLPNE